MLMIVDRGCCGVVCGIRVRELRAWDALPLLSDFPECDLSVSGVGVEYLAPQVPTILNLGSARCTMPVVMAGIEVLKDKFLIRYITLLAI
jgi:hypothetical protein